MPFRIDDNIIYIVVQLFTLSIQLYGYTYKQFCIGLVKYVVIFISTYYLINIKQYSYLFTHCLNFRTLLLIHTNRCSDKPNIPFMTRSKFGIIYTAAANNNYITRIYYIENTIFNIRIPF